MDIEEIPSPESFSAFKIAIGMSLPSASCVYPSFSAAMSHLILGGAIPASMQSDSILVGFMHPVMILQV